MRWSSAFNFRVWRIVFDPLQNWLPIARCSRSSARNLTQVGSPMLTVEDLKDAAILVQKLKDIFRPNVSNFYGSIF